MPRRAVVILGLLATLTGCVEESVRRAPAHVGAAPAEIPVTALELFAGSAFDDTDGNGWRDTLTVVAYLFSPGSDYPLSLRRDGAFTFRIVSAEQRPMAEWVFDRAATAAALRQDLPPGPGYVFTLDLRPQQREGVPLREVWVKASFAPAAAESTSPAMVERQSAGAVLVGEVR